VKKCPIDEEHKRIWREKFEIEDEGCILLRAITGFKASKCRLKEKCKKLNKELRESKIGEGN